MSHTWAALPIASVLDRAFDRIEKLEEEARKDRECIEALQDLVRKERALVRKMGRQVARMRAELRAQRATRGPISESANV